VKLRRRQIHMDFHTSPAIGDVGVDFDPDVFADTLARAHVDSVTCFAKCHHGMFYYNSKVGPRHPALKFDLLAKQIRACHKRDILVPVYVSVQWESHAGSTHPEWRAVSPDGKLPGPLLNPIGGCSWPLMCVLTGYRRYLADTIVELLENYAIDGLFFDIVQDIDSCSSPALDRMRAEGVNPDDPAQRKAFSRRVMIEFIREFTALVHKHRRGLPVFYNGRIGIPMRDSLPHLTHLEVESLPSAFWGYGHFQRVGRHVRLLGKPFLGMTARFHKSWADFGTLKPAAALEYESLTALAHGGGVSIGDQLHPRGTLEEATYEQIGTIYGKIRDLEPWCENARPVTQVGVLSLLTKPDADEAQAEASDSGAVGMLNETHHLFDVLDMDCPFDPYELLVLPDAIAPHPKLLKKLRDYLRQGGRLLVTGRSLLNADKNAFALPALKVDHRGPLDHQPYYLRLRKGFADDTPPNDYVMYEQGLRVRPQKGGTVQAWVVEPYFNRTVEHYCSHFQTPPNRLTRDAVVVLTKQTAYINAPIFRAYAEHGNLIYRRIVSACIEHLLPGRLLRTSLPTSARVSILEQRVGRRLRWTLHMLHYPPTRRHGSLELIEEPMPLSDVAVEMRCRHRVAVAQTVPDTAPLPFEQDGERVRFVVPSVPGHKAVALTLAP